jgi:hypothetical protein
VVVIWDQTVTVTDPPAVIHHGLELLPGNFDEPTPELQPLLAPSHTAITSVTPHQDRYDVAITQLTGMGKLPASFPNDLDINQCWIAACRLLCTGCSTSSYSCR